MRAAGCVQVPPHVAASLPASVTRRRPAAIPLQRVTQACRSTRTRYARAACCGLGWAPGGATTKLALRLRCHRRLDEAREPALLILISRLRARGPHSGMYSSKD